MDQGVWRHAQVLPAWHGAALRGALLPVNGLRTMSTVLVMVGDNSVASTSQPLFLRVFRCAGHSLCN